MSFHPTNSRPLARGGWGGRAANHWRGALAQGQPLIGLTEYDPQVLGTDHWGQIGTVFYRSVGGFANWEITGVTRNSSGTVLASCAIDLFEAGSDLLKDRVVSGADGSFTLSNPGTGPFYLVAYKAGSPDVAGTTVNTLMPTAFAYPVSTAMPDYYDIVLLAGQSNMSGRGTYNAGIDTTDANVYQYGCYDGAGTYRTIFAGSDPLTMPDTVAAPNGVGPGMFFAKRYSAVYNRKVLLVPFARGGTSLVTGSTTWSPYGTNDADYLSAIDQANRAVTAAVAAFPGSSFKGICWLQGEGDGENSVTTAAYQSALADLIAGMRAGITGATSAWFVMGQMVPEAISFRAGYPAIDTAHTNIGTNYPYATKVTIGTGYDSGDQLHYNAAGARLMGTTMANGVATAGSNAGESVVGQVTGLTTGTATNTSMPLSWTAPASGTVRDYQIQYSLAGVNSWTTVSDGVSTATSGTATGLTAGTSYDFRVRATNYNTTAGAWSATATASTSAGLSDAFVRLTAIAGSLISESGSAGVGWTYTCDTGAAYTVDHAGTSNLKMPSGVDGSLRCIYTLDDLASTRMVGLVTSQTNPAYNDGASGYKYGVLNHNSDTYRMIYEGGGSSQDPDTTLAPADGDVIRFVRSSGTVLCQVARTATPTTFTTIHTFAATYTGDLWAGVTFNTSAAGGSVATLIGNGWA